MRYILLVIAFVTFFSCRKSHDACGGGNMNDSTICTDGSLIWSGPVEADGLGWTLRLNNDQHTFYCLKEPATSFSKDTATAVHACINKTKDKVCSWGGCFDMYEIKTISRN
jgi:hypothetical protein